MVRKLVLVCVGLILSGCAEKKIKYGDCLEVKDSFYGSFYGTVIGKINNEAYKIMIGNIFLPIVEIYGRDLKVVDNKKCQE